jgi:integrase
VPDLDRLPENNVRDVDVTPKQFATVLEHLPEHLRPVAVFGYITGWRKHEILSRTWADVDWDAGWVYLDRSTAKNNQPKAFPLGVVPWLDDTLREQEQRKLEVEKATDRIVLNVFFYVSGEWAGEPFDDFRNRGRRPARRQGSPACGSMTCDGARRFRCLRRGYRKSTRSGSWATRRGLSLTDTPSPTGRCYGRRRRSSGSTTGTVHRSRIGR